MSEILTERDSCDYMEIVKEYIVDAALLGIFFLNVIVYYRKSFTKAILEFVAFFGASLMAKFYSEPAARFIMRKTSIFSDPYGKEKATLVMIVVLFILISVALNVIIYYADKWFKLPVSRTANKLMGMALGILVGFVITGACVALIKALQLSGYGLLDELAGNSRIIKVYTELLAKYYPYVAELIKKGV